MNTKFIRTPDGTQQIVDVNLKAGKYFSLPDYDAIDNPDIGDNEDVGGYLRYNAGVVELYNGTTWGAISGLPSGGDATKYLRGDGTYQILDTSVVPENTNLYYTATRFNTAFGAKSTTDLTEGTNLYYTAGRFNSAFSGKSTSDLSEGSNLYYTAARFNSAFAGKNTDGLAEGSSNLYFTNARVQSYSDGRYVQLSNANVANGWLQLNSLTKIDAAYLPSYVSDIVTVANFAALPGTGTAGFIYITADDNKEYRWNAGTSAYIELSASPGTTDALAEGAVNLYYTLTRFNSAFGGKSTTDLAEGSNLYYTSTRFNTAFSAKSTSDLAEGSNLYFTTARVQTVGDSRYYGIGNPSGFISGISGGMVTTALGYTPADDTLVLHKAGAETVTGAKTFNADLEVVDSYFLTAKNLGDQAYLGYAYSNVYGRTLIGNNETASKCETDIVNVQGSSVSNIGGFRFITIGFDGEETFSNCLFELKGDTGDAIVYGGSVIVASPDGTHWRLNVSNAGVLTVASV